MNLREQALSGVKWTAAENIFNVVASVISVAVLARVLHPQDFGLMALAGVVLGFCQLFVDMGISNGIIHRQDVSHSQLSTLYWANIAAACLVFALVAAAASPLGTFYHEPELARVIVFTAITLLVQPFGQQFAVLLRKELQFDSLAQIGIVSRAAGLVAAVALAYYGWGVYSLVYSALATTGIATVMTIRLGIRIHRPSLRFRPTEVSHFFSFGAYQMGEGTINYFNSNLDSVLIGRLLGADALGLYAVAKQFVMRPAQIVNPVITRVSTPVMARVQDDLPRLRRIYLQTVGHLSSLNFPIYAAIAAFAEEITLLLFGPRWVDAVPVMRILAIYMAIRSTANPVGSLLLARGKVRLGFWWNLGLLLVFPAAIYAGATWGVTGVAWSLLLMQFLLLVPMWRLLVRPLCGASFYEYHKELVAPTVAAVLGAGAGYLAAAPLSSSIVRLAAGFVAGGLAVLLMYFLFNRDFLRALHSLLRHKH